MTKARRGFSLVEVMIAGVVFFVILMVFQTIFQLSTRGEGRDLRRTQALLQAAEVLEQVTLVHARFGDLPVKDCPISSGLPGSTTLFRNPGGEIEISTDVPQFQRRLVIRELRIGKEDPLVLPDRLYQILVRVSYPGPVGEPREEVLTTTRARKVIMKPVTELPPWL